MTQVREGRQVEEQLVGAAGQGHVQVQCSRGHRGPGDHPSAGLEPRDSLRCEWDFFFLFLIEEFKSNYNWGKCPRHEARKN